MEDLEKQVIKFCEDTRTKDYYYKGVLYETFYEYQYMYENYDDYKDIIPKELITYDKLVEITDSICDNEYLTSILHESMYNEFMEK